VVRSDVIAARLRAKENEMSKESVVSWKGRRPAEAMREWAKGYSEVVQLAGQRAIDYHVDTGECLFCNTDGDGRHEHHCELGRIFGTSDRIASAPLTATQESSKRGVSY